MSERLQNTEVWIPIKGLENYFAVSNTGKVKNINTGNVLKPRITRGYEYVILDIKDGEFRFRRNIPIHRLVAQEFCPNRLNKKQVNHIDGNKLNNIVENLEWVTPSENIRHAMEIGLIKAVKGKTKFSVEQIKKVFELRSQDYKHKEIAAELGMGVSTVTHILLGTRRKNYRQINS